MYGGTKEEMQRLIADASQMSTEMEKLGVSVDADSMSFDNIINAISVMQEHLSISGTTANEASGTIEGSVNSMKAAWDNFLAGTMDGDQFAEVAITAVDNIVGAFSEIIPRLITGFAEMTPALLEKGAEIVGNLITTIQEKLPDVLEQGREMISNIGQGLVDGIPDFLANALPMIEQFTANLRENAGKFVDSGIEFITNLVQGIANSLPTLIQYVPTIVSNVANVINDNMPKILKAGWDLIVILLKGIVQAVPTLIAEFPKICQAIIDVWKAINWLAIGQHVINFIASGIKGLAATIPNLLKNIGDSAFNLFKSISWSDLGWAIIDGIKNALLEGISSIIDVMTDLASSALDTVKSFLGIHSPSRRFRDEVGKQIVAGEAEGITDNADMVEDAITDVQEKTLDASMDVNYDLPNTDSVSKDIGASFTSRLTQTVNRVIEVPLNISGREVARATAWDMGEQLAWESR